MSMTTSKILKFVNFTETEKYIYTYIYIYIYIYREQSIVFSSNKKKLIAQQGLYDKKYFCSRGKLKVLSTKIQQEAETVSGTVLQQRCSRIYG